VEESEEQFRVEEEEPGHTKGGGAAGWHVLSSAKSRSEIRNKDADTIAFGRSLRSWFSYPIQAFRVRLVYAFASRTRIFLHAAFLGVRFFCFLEGLPARDSPFSFPSKVAAIGVWREEYIHNHWKSGVLILFGFWYRAYRMGNYIGWSFGI